MSEKPPYAIIHVRVDQATEAWPVVERVPDGWQSGVHHYDDDNVLDITPLPMLPKITDEVIERASEASWRVADGYISGTPWPPQNGYRVEKERRRARAVIASLIGEVSGDQH